MDFARRGDTTKQTIVAVVKYGVRWLLAPAVATPLAVFILTRILFVVLTYIGVILLQSVAPHPPLQAPQSSFIHALLPAWNQWDARWYLDIAQRGYGWKNPAGTTPTAFFPLFPLLVHALHRLSWLSPASCALVISNLCFLGALGYLWRLCQWETDRGTARRTVVYISTFPTALFFFAGYTESLFLLLTVAAFFYLRRGDWMLAGLCGGLASATRVTGILLLVPFVYEYARDSNFSPRDMVRMDAMGALLIPSGLLAFMVYLSRAVGDPMAFAHGQVGWQKVFTVRLWSGLTGTVHSLITEPVGSFNAAHNIIELCAALLFLAGTVAVARKLSPSYALYLLAFWLMTLSSPALQGGYPIPLVSWSRYVLTLFPVFMVFGLQGRRSTFNDVYLIVSCGLLGVLTVLFVNGRWIV